MDGYSGAGVLESEKAKPAPRSEPTKPIIFHRPKRGAGFQKPKPAPRLEPGKRYQMPGPKRGAGLPIPALEARASLQPSKTPPLSLL